MADEAGQLTAGAQAIADEYMRLLVDGWSPDLEEFLGRVPEEMRAVVGALIRAEMSPHDAEAFAREYLRLLEEGWEPDLEEYVGRVPEAVREAVLVLIDAALANPPEVAQEPYLEPAVEVESPEEACAAVIEEEVEEEVAYAPPGRGARLLSLLVPARIRDAWIGEWVFARADRRALGLPALEVNLLSFEELLDGIAQRAPLRDRNAGGHGGAERSEVPPGQSAGQGGAMTRLCWGAWRLGGPVLLVGAAVPALPVALAGAGLLGIAVAGALVWRGSDRAVVLVNGVLGGLRVAAASWLLLLAAALVPGLAAMAAGHGMLAARIAGLVALLALARVTAKGRVPAPWAPRHLARLSGPAE